MKTLMFDLEHGSQTLGSKEYILKQFGFPVLQPGTGDQFQNTIAKLYKQETVTEKIKVGNLEIDEQRITVVPLRGTTAMRCSSISRLPTFIFSVIVSFLYSLPSVSWN